MKKIILSMVAGLIDDFICDILSVPFCPFHFVHTILSNTILSVYHFAHTILSVPFCPLPFCPRTPTSPEYQHSAQLLIFYSTTSSLPASSLLAIMKHVSLS